MNTDTAPRRKVALIAGPTASGKSALAAALGRTLPSVVVNADSAQVYADLRILSARPSDADMAGVAHALFGHVDGRNAYSAAAWAADARAVIAEADKEGQTPILTGGTGLYIRTLLDGIAPVPEIDSEVRQTVRALTVADAHTALMVEDPVAGTRLMPGDTTRIARALEVVRSTGRPLSAWQAERVGGIGDMIDLVPLVLLPPRDWLMERIDRRFADMIDHGAVEEVAALLARGLDPALPAMRAIGVAEIREFLNGAIDRETMVARGRIATRQYAKRQYTWFRRQPPAEWTVIEAQLDDSMVDVIVTKLRDQLLTA